MQMLYMFGQIKKMHIFLGKLNLQRKLEQMLVITMKTMLYNFPWKEREWFKWADKRATVVVARTRDKCEHY